MSSRVVIDGAGLDQRADADLAQADAAAEGRGDAQLLQPGLVLADAPFGLAGQRLQRLEPLRGDALAELQATGADELAARIVEQRARLIELRADAPRRRARRVPRPRARAALPGSGSAGTMPEILAVMVTASRARTVPTALGPLDHAGRAHRGRRRRRPERRRPGRAAARSVPQLPAPPGRAGAAGRNLRHTCAKPPRRPRSGPGWLAGEEFACDPGSYRAVLAPQ